MLRSSAARFCPVAGRVVHLDSDYKRKIRVGLTVYDAGVRVEIAADGANRDGLVWLPKFFGHNSGAVAAYVDGGCEFVGRTIRAIEVHKRLHRKASFLSARGGRLWQRVSFGPGRPALGRLPVGSTETYGTEGQRPVGLVSAANPTKAAWQRGVTPREKTGDLTFLLFRSGFRIASHVLAGRSCGH
jgi:hypothetical protein